ncbi:MAG: hypothetical protein WBP45_04895, partial [Daejeonella sp.]
MIQKNMSIKYSVLKIDSEEYPIQNNIFLEGTYRVTGKFTNKDVEKLKAHHRVESIWFTAQQDGDSWLLLNDFLALRNVEIRLYNGVNNINGYSDKGMWTDLSGLAVLKNLEWLNIKDRSLSNIDVLAQLVNLKKLGIEHSSSNIDVLAQLINLKTLSIEHSSKSISAKPILELRLLEDLSLCGNFKDINLRNLVNLKALILTYVKITGPEIFPDSI